MNAPASRKSRNTNTGWSLIRVCLCCGKFVVLLKLPAFGSKTDPRWYRLCYFKGWDGSPYYTKGVAIPHPRKWIAQALDKLETSPSEPRDPFFEL